MKHVVEAGTDAAGVVLFDPLALPAEFDRLDGGEQADRVRALADAGRVVWVNTDGDGSFVLHAFVGEPIPDDLAPVLRDPKTYEPFAAPSGRVVFAGVECSFRDDDTLWRNHPHMGQEFAVPAGDYRLTWYEVAFPDDEKSRRWAEGLTPGQRWVLRAGRGFGCAAVPAAVAGLAGLAVVSVWAWLTVVVPAVLVLGGVAWVVARGRAYQAAWDAERAVRLSMPDYVARLERL